MSSHDYSMTMGARIHRFQRKRDESGGGIKDGTFEAIKAYLNYKHTSEYVRDLPLHPRR